MTGHAAFAVPNETHVTVGGPRVANGPPLSISHLAW